MDLSLDQRIAFDRLTALGFETELTGGGCTCLSRYFEDGTHIWATESGGLHLPDADGWIVNAYPADFDGDYENLPYQNSGQGLIELVHSALSAEYHLWLAANPALPKVAAEELIHETLTDEQRRWVSDFILRWEAEEQKGETVPQWRAEFPDFPAADLPELPEGFTDTSWHNDACPSFESEELKVKVWTEYADPKNRELGPDAPRFIVSPVTDDGLGDDLFAADNWPEVSGFLSGLKAGRG